MATSLASFIDQSNPEQIDGLQNSNENPNGIQNDQKQYSAAHRRNKKIWSKAREENLLGKRDEFHSSDEPTKHDDSDKLTTSNSLDSDPKILSGSSARSVETPAAKRQQYEKEYLSFYEPYWVYFYCYNSIARANKGLDLEKNTKGKDDQEYNQVQLRYFWRKTVQYRERESTSEERVPIMHKDSPNGDPIGPIPDDPEEIKVWETVNTKWRKRKATQLNSFKYKRLQRKIPRLPDYEKQIRLLAEKNQFSFKLPDDFTEPNQAVEREFGVALEFYFCDTTFADFADLPREEAPPGFLVPLKRKDKSGRKFGVNPNYDSEGQAYSASKITEKVYDFLQKITPPFPPTEEKHEPKSGTRKKSQIKRSPTQSFGMEAESMSTPPSLFLKVAEESNPIKVEEFEKSCSAILEQHQMEMGELQRLTNTVIQNFGSLDNQSNIIVLHLISQASEHVLRMCQDELILANFFVMFVRLRRIRNNKFTNPDLLYM